MNTLFQRSYFHDLTAIFILFTQSACLQQASLTLAPVSSSLGSSFTSGDLFPDLTLINPPPTVSGLIPNSGVQSGGTVISVIGTGFYVGGTFVTIDGNPCTPVTFISSTLLTCITPAHSSTGLNSVTVTNADQQFAVRANSFYYTSTTTPTLTAVLPVSGTSSGGTPVTLTGTGFQPGVSASFDGVTCTNSTYVSSTTMTCVTPAHYLGTANVTVNNPDQGSSSAGAVLFTYLGDPPTITGLNPAAGGSGEEVTISGTNFWPNSTVTMTQTGSATPALCSNPTFINNQTIKCTTPLAPGNYTLTVNVTNPDGNVSIASVVGANIYTYQLGVNKISSGGNSSCAVANGAVQCWGQNDFGQLGTNDYADRATPLPVISSATAAALNHVQDVAIGRNHACAIVNGGLACWGRNTFGQLGLIGADSYVPKQTGVYVPKLIGVSTAVTGITSVSVGDDHTCIISQGQVYCVGSNILGQLGTNAGTDQTGFESDSLVTFTTNGAKIVSAGKDFTCAHIGGGVQCWGNNSVGQIGNSDGTAVVRPNVYAPTIVSNAVSAVSDLSAGRYHACAVVAGAARCWGLNNMGQVGAYATRASALPFVNGSVSVLGLTSGVQAIAAGDYHTCAIRNGLVYCWGNNAYGQLGTDPSSVASGAPGFQSFSPVVVPGITGAKQLSLGKGHSCAIANQKVVCWGTNIYGQLGNPKNSGAGIKITSPITVPGINSGIFRITGAGSQACAQSPGAIQCWGDNSMGQLGSGHYASSSFATNVISLGTLAPNQMAVGKSHACASGLTGVRCWGSNVGYALANGPATPISNVPMAVSLPQPVRQSSTSYPIEFGLAAGMNTSFYINDRPGGSCWGNNSYGQLRSGATTNQSYPLEFGRTVEYGFFHAGLDDFFSLTAGTAHTCFTTLENPGDSRGGTISCGGNNQFGQLGDYRFYYGIQPQDNSPDSGLYSHLRKEDGTVFTPSNNQTTFTSAGGFHTCTLNTPAAVAGAAAISTPFCWGSNEYGQLGSTAVTPGTLGATYYGTIPTGLGIPTGTLGTTNPTVNSVSGIYTGEFHTCAVMANGGTVKCWGSNRYGQLGVSNSLGSFTAAPQDVPNVSGVTSMALGEDFSCALGSFGIACWGGNFHGQLGSPVLSASSHYSADPLPVTGFGSGITMLATGANHACTAVNGTAVCWGKNDLGQLGNGTTSNAPSPRTVLLKSTNDTPFTSSLVSGDTTSLQKLASGDSHSCVIIAASGKVQCWGSNQFGQLGNNSQTSSNIPQTVVTSAAGNPALTQIQALAAGGGHTCALAANKTIWCWGKNTNGQLGNGTLTTTSVAKQVPGFNFSVTSISAGSTHTCALTDTYGLYCWGGNQYQQVTSATTSPSGTASSSVTRPVLVPSLGTATLLKKVVTGQSHTCVLYTDTTAVKCFGSNLSYQLGTSALPASNMVADIVAGANHTCLLVSGSVQCFGLGTSGQLGSGIVSSATVLTAVSSGAVSIAAGGEYSCATLATGIMCWGNNLTGQLGNGSSGVSSSPTAALVTASAQFTGRVAAGGLHACVIVTATGGVQCWGNNIYGQLGNGINDSSSTAQSVTTTRTLTPLTNVQAITTGTDHTCALVNGSVYCWGSNSNGKLGTGSLSPASSAYPLPVMSSASVVLTNVQAIVAGKEHTCADSLGSVYCWGDNTYGQLGIGSTTTPGLYPATNPASSTGKLSAGDYNTCLVGNPGVVCWGKNDVGQIGTGTVVNPTTGPGNAATGTIEELTAMGSSHGCAITSTTGAKPADNTYRTLSCWGSNSKGQLGNSSTTNSSSPVSTGLTAVQLVSTGSNHTCAIQAGQVYCWGDNTYGQIAQAITTTSLSTPAVVAGTGFTNSGAQAIAAGGTFTCALIDGYPWCWGDNTYGQLANGTVSTTPNMIPTAIAGF